ncbi:MAG TPA: cation:proton antiporter [Ktedonobacterales bacterium]|jgi:CPA1 family monovalent cation:H+ antiporter|nr:cation:proton antiporter [Ktedonobacterales bacterium]
MPTTLHGTVETLLVLLLIVFVVAVIVQRIRLPYTVALVVVGFLGLRPGFLEVSLTPDLILLVFLPVLLFEGAYNVPANRLWRNVLPITLLAVPGVLIGTLVTGAIIHFALNLSWQVGFLFGALISSTDPIAVVALFRDLGVPRRLALLIEGESLFNDGAAITIFQIVLAAIVTGAFGLAHGIAQFIITVAGALLVGGLVGYIGSRLLRAVDSAQIQITATVVAAYGAYLFADTLHFSGAIAVVVTALFFGNFGAARGLSPRSVLALSATWEFLAFVANSLVFLLIGITLDPLLILQNLGIITIAFLAALVGRAVVVYLVVPLIRSRQAIPRPYLPVLLWGGLRGVVSLALALSIPFTLPSGQPFPDRSVLQVIAFGVVGASLLLQSLTMAPLIRRLGLKSERSGTKSREAADLLHARLAAVEGALLTLDRERERGEVGPLQYQRLASAYQSERAQIQEQIAPLDLDLDIEELA